MPRCVHHDDGSDNKNRGMGKGQDTVLPIGVGQGEGVHYKSLCIHNVCEWVSVSLTHTYSWLTSNTSAGVAWAVCHVWWPAPAAGLALSTPACCDLCLTPCTSFFVGLALHLCIFAETGEHTFPKASFTPKWFYTFFLFFFKTWQNCLQSAVDHIYPVRGQGSTQESLTQVWPHKHVRNRVCKQQCWH